MNEAKLNNESLQRINITLEEKLTDQMVGNHAADNVELIELRRTMVECEIELHELRDQYLSIKSKAENDLNKEHKKIGRILREFCIFENIFIQLYKNEKFQTN